MKSTLKALFLSILLLLTTCASSGDSATNKDEKMPSDDLSKKALNKLYQSIAKDNQSIELKNDEIVAGETRIQVSAITEHDLNKDEQWVFAVRFDTKLIGTKETQLTVGTVGVGENRQDAVETSIDEWIGFFGTALSQMLVNSDKALTVGDYKVFPGLMGIRGELPAQTWMDGGPKMNEKIINSVGSIIKESEGEVILINVLLNVDKTGLVDGECRINNIVSESLLDKIKKMNWKTSSTGYLFKQIYLLKKN